MTDDFVWPSDKARAENVELNRVCEYLEEVLDSAQGAEPVAYYNPDDQYWIDNGGKVSVCGQMTPTFKKPLYTQPAAKVPESVIRKCEQAIEYASEIRGGCISGVREGQKRVRAILSTPQQSGEWNKVLTEIAAERERQDRKWGGPEHDDQKAPNDFVQHIQDYAGWARVMAGMGSMDKYRRRMVQVAALAVAAVETTDRCCDNPPKQEGE